MYICQDASILCKAQKATVLVSKEKCSLSSCFVVRKQFEKFSSSNLVLFLILRKATQACCSKIVFFSRMQSIILVPKTYTWESSQGKKDRNERKVQNLLSFNRMYFVLFLLIRFKIENFFTKLVLDKFFSHLSSSQLQHTKFGLAGHPRNLTCLNQVE